MVIIGIVILNFSKALIFVEVNWHQRFGSMIKKREITFNKLGVEYVYFWETKIKNELLSIYNFIKKLKNGTNIGKEND